MIIDMTLATSFELGTNLKGKLAGNWTYLLPNLDLDCMLCLGVPNEAALETFARLSRRVLVAASDVERLQVMSRPTVEPILLNGNPMPPLAENSLDLVYVGEGHDVAQLMQASFMAELRRALKPEGLLYFEQGGPKSRGQLDRAAAQFAQRLGRMNHFWVTPMIGEMETAVPASDKQMIDFFVKSGLYSPAITLPKRVPLVEPAIEKAEKFIWKKRPLHNMVQKHGLLVGPADKDLANKVPQYLHDALAKVGFNGDDYRWGIVARGLYRSRKVIFFLFEEGAKEPQIVVKMTRGGENNYRLENEFRGLDWMRQKGLFATEMPQPVFLDHHGGLALMGQTAVFGTPFQKRTNHSPDCPYATMALEWLIDLSAKTVQVTSPQAAADALEQLYAQYKIIYQPNAEREAFLDKQMATLRHGTEPFPLVFQHGDPGTWNVLIAENGRPVFLDWEASEPMGMPLWDFFYFLRSYSVGVARAKGSKNSLAGFEQQFLQSSSLSPMISRWVRRYCQAINLPQQYVEPLFYTCWMHRALKQATRMTERNVHSGHYIKLQRLCIDQRQAPTLQHLFDYELKVAA